MTTIRRKNFLWGAFSGWTANVITTVIGIISAPLGLRYFGVERYGAIAIISTLLTYLSTCQIGLPTTVNVLAAKALDKLNQLRIILKAFILTLIIVIVVSAGFLLYTHYTPHWLNLLGKIPSTIYHEVSQATFVSAILFLINLPLSMFIGGFVANQKVYIERFYSTLSAIMPFLALLVVIGIKGNLVVYCLIRGILTIIVSLFGAIHFLLFYEDNRIYIKAKFTKLFQPSDVEEFSVQSILATGLRFFIIGLATMVVWNTDNLIISHFLGLKAVTPYSITFKLITSTFFIFSAASFPIIPMFGRAYASGDYQWIEQTCNKMIVSLSLLGGLVWIGSIAFAQDIINLWVGPKGYAGMLTVFSLGGYAYFCSVINGPGSLSTGLNFINIFIAWSEAIVNFVLSLVFVKYFNLGIGGTALGTFLGAVLTVFWMLPVYIHKRSKGKIKLNYLPMIKNFLSIILPFLVCVFIIYYFPIDKNVKRILNMLIVGLYGLITYRILPEEIKEIFLHFWNRPIFKNRKINGK